MSFSKRIAINAIGFLVIAAVIPQFVVSNWIVAILASLVLAGLNALIKPILLIITLPITIVTFGLFSFILNAMMLSLTAAFVPGFYFTSFWITIVVSILLAIFQRFIETLTE